MSETNAEKKGLDVDWEALVAGAVQRLVKLDHAEPAIALAEARIVRMWGRRDWTLVDIQMEVPGDLFDALTRPGIYANDEDENDFGNAYEVEGSSVLARTFTSVLPPGVECRRVEVKIRLDPVSDTWRDEFSASVGRGAVNQGNVPGVASGEFVTNDGVRYRSMTEVTFANELKRRDVLFFPLPVAVVNGVRHAREPDFVVIHGGRVGILEIHGEKWHPPSRAAEDHAKAMPYRLRGAEHLIVDATEAFNTPEKVVDKLLALLERKS